MKIGIYGKVTATTDFDILDEFFDFMQDNDIDFLINPDYTESLMNRFGDESGKISDHNCLEQEEMKQVDFAYSFGGDGTLLSTVRQIGNAGTPVLGVNFGRLGFLTSVTQNELIQATNDLKNGKYKLDKRAPLIVESDPGGVFEGENFGLNDLTIHKSKTNEMITVHAYINGEFLNSFWGDGLIISTPTGSTAYSLSCGGPVVHPRADVLTITPVAPHSLTIRPMVIPDHYVVSLEIESRAGEAMLSLDTRTELVKEKTEIAVKKADFSVNLVRMEAGKYLNMLRGRLMWGRDSRN